MRNVLSRRQMLARTAFGATAFALASEYAPLFAARDQRGFKIGACDWNLGKMADPAALEVAKEIGLDGVQISLGSAKDDMHLRQSSVQQAYLDAANKTGVALASLAIGELNNIPLKSAPIAKTWVRDSIDVLKALGLKVVLIAEFGNGELKGDKPGIDRTVEIMKELAPLAEKAGVILGLENYLSAEENLDILDRVKSPAVQVYYDVGNSTDKGYDIYKEIRMLKGKVCEFHAKNNGATVDNRGNAQGKVDFAKVREAMDAIDYRGWIQLETPAPLGLVPDYKQQLAFLKKLFPATV